MREGQAVELYWQEGESDGEWFAALVRQLTAESVLLFYEKTHEEERIQRSDVTRGMLRSAASPSSGKKKKDKNAPKRRTAFNFFAKQVRTDMCEKASNLNELAPSIAVVNQRVSALWGPLDADGRKPFAALAEVRSHPKQSALYDRTEASRGLTVVVHRRTSSAMRARWRVTCRRQTLPPRRQPSQVRPVMARAKGACTLTRGGAGRCGLGCDRKSFGHGANGGFCGDAPQAADARQAQAGQGRRRGQGAAASRASG